MQVEAASIEAQDLRWRLGDTPLRIARARARQLSATLAPAGPGQPPRLLGATAAELELLGVELEPADWPGLPEVSTLRGEQPRLDALGAMQGLLHAFVTDAVWVVDAEVRVALRDGRIDFNQVAVEHIGPDSSMGISRGGLYIDSPKLGRQYLYLFTARDIPGTHFETRQGRKVRDRGQLDLRAFAQGLWAQGRPAPPGKMANRHVESTLDRTRLTGELQFGDGALGSTRRHVVLTGQAEGKNRLIVSAAVLSHKLVLRMPDLAAREARFALAGLDGTSGPISADLSARVSGLGNGSPPELALSLGHLKVEDLRVGEV